MARSSVGWSELRKRLGRWGGSAVFVLARDSVFVRPPLTEPMRPKQPDQSVPTHSLIQETPHANDTHYVYRVARHPGFPDRGIQRSRRGSDTIVFAQPGDPVSRRRFSRSCQSLLLLGGRSSFQPANEPKLDLLRLLGTDVAGPDIARQVLESLSTLRTHTRSIYSELGVNNRRAAVRRAEEVLHT
jgi:hypothetical protein